MSTVAMMSVGPSADFAAFFQSAALQLVILAAEAALAVGLSWAVSRPERCAAWAAQVIASLSHIQCSISGNEDDHSEAKPSDEVVTASATAPEPLILESSMPWEDKSASPPSLELKQVVFDSNDIDIDELIVADLADDISGVTLADLTDHLGPIRPALLLEDWCAPASDPDIDLARSHGLARRADLAVELWLERSAAAGACVEDAAAAAPLSDRQEIPAAALYGAVLEACAMADDMEAAASVARVAGWRSPPCAGGQAVILALARWQAQRQELGVAVQIYEGVRAVGGSCDLPTFHALVAAAVRGSDMRLAATLFRDLNSSGLEPGFRTYSVLIQGYCTVGDLEQAMMLFHLMQKRGLVPDTALFNVVLDSCAWRNMPVLAEGVLADMERLGAVPSSRTLSILLRLYGRARDLPRALAAFEELPRRHVFEPNSSSYGTLISVCLDSNRLDLALESFDQMSAADIPASARTFEVLVSGCMRHGDLDRAVGLVDRALGLGASAGRARASLEPRAVEALLSLIGRRRQVRRLGAPLLLRLQRAGFEVCETVSASILRASQPGAEHGQSPLQRRQAERGAWQRCWPDKPRNANTTL